MKMEKDSVKDFKEKQMMNWMFLGEILKEISKNARIMR
jgi:hypothetical protein